MIAVCRLRLWSGLQAGVFMIGSDRSTGEGDMTKFRDCFPVVSSRNAASAPKPCAPDAVTLA